VKIHPIPLEGLSLHCTNPQSRRGERKTIWIFWRHAANVWSINHRERRGRDSNPRYPRGYNGFRDRPDRPLRHLSRCHKHMVMWEASPTRERPRHASLGNHGTRRISPIPPPARNRPRSSSASSDRSVSHWPQCPVNEQTQPGNAARDWASNRSSDRVSDPSNGSSLPAVGSAATTPHRRCAAPPHRRQREGKDELIKASVDLQDLRRRL
jgi:hypothetical protein